MLAALGGHVGKEGPNDLGILLQLFKVFPIADGKTRQIGVARYVTNPDGETVEFALAVADDWQKHGVGRKLMSSLIEVARQKGYRAVVGDVLSVMRDLAKTGLTMMVVTHEMGFAREVANRVIFMDDGRILESGDPKEFFANPKTQRAREFLSKVL